MEPSKESALRLLHDAPIGVAMVDAEGAFRWVNQAYCKFLDYTEGQLMSLKWQDITDDQFVKVDAEYAQKVRDGAMQGYTIVKAYKKNGSRQEALRLCYGTLTVFREPTVGPFQHYWALFVPHDVQERQRNPINIKEIAAFTKDNWRWMIVVGAISAALITGNWSVALDILRKFNGLDSLPQGVESPGSSPSLPSP